MDRISKLISARSRIQKVINYAMLPKKNGGWYFKVPGLKNDDFNRAGLPSVNKISRMGEMNYLTPVLNDLNADQSNRQCIFVLKGRMWTFSRQFYSQAAVNFPMTLYGSVSRIGQSSFDAVQQYYADEEESEPDSEYLNTSNTKILEKEPVLNCITRLVYVNTKTWKAESLPEDLLRTLSPLTALSDETFPILSHPTSMPDQAFKWLVKVRYDDLDHQFHVNQASYLLYATECAAQAASEGYYSRFVEDIAFYPVRRAYGVHLAEAQVNDELEISTWEDTDEKMRLHFTANNEGRTIYYAQVDFFDSVL